MTTHNDTDMEESYYESNLNIFNKNCLSLAQEINYHKKTIWTLKFSPDGKYLCSGGEDTNVVVWSIESVDGVSETSSYHDSDISSLTSEDAEDKNSRDYKGLIEDINKVYQREQIIRPIPYRVFEGHIKDVVDVAWSKSNFILSASADKTVSLWLVAEFQRLQVFQHPDIVTCVDFHPMHDRFFVSGCFDRRIRVWDIIPEGTIKEWAQAPEPITAVTFGPDGASVTAGLFNGQVYFYTTDLKYVTQMDCKNRKGKFSHGKKVTGITFLVPSEELSDRSNDGEDEGSASRSRDIGKHSLNSGIASSATSLGSKRVTGNNKSDVFNLSEAIVVTTNDNRIRLIQMENYSTISKFRGLKNASKQIKAHVSADLRYIICGSDNGKVYIWSTTHNAGKKKSWLSFFSKHNSLTDEIFETIDCTGNSLVSVTAAVFAPPSSVKRLQYACYIKEGIPLTDSVEFPSEENRADFSSRIIATAAEDGRLRIYVRNFNQLLPPKIAT